MEDKEEFPCNECLLYPICVGKYRSWKEIMIRDGYEGVSASKYVNCLCNKCKVIDQYLFEHGSHDTERFLARSHKLTRKFDGHPL